MTKTEFLNLLEQRLMVLNASERADLLSEYEQHIEMKVSSGLSEDEAITDFGDFDELIKELLEAYHLNTDYSKSNQFSATATYYIKSCANFLTNLMESLFSMNRRQLVQLFFKCCGLLLFYMIFLGIIEITCNMFYSFFVFSMPFGNSFGRFVAGIFRFVAYLFFLAVSIYLGVFFIKRYILINYQPLEQPTYSTSEHTMHPSETIERIKQKTSQFSEKVVHSLDLNDSKIYVANYDGPSLGEMCMSILVFCLKFMAFFILLGGAVTTFCLIIGTGLLMVFLLMGYSFIGPFMITLGCTAIAAVCTLVVFHFIFGGVKA